MTNPITIQIELEILKQWIQWMEEIESPAVIYRPDPLAMAEDAVELAKINASNTRKQIQYYVREIR